MLPSCHCAGEGCYSITPSDVDTGAHTPGMTRSLQKLAIPIQEHRRDRVAEMNRQKRNPSLR